jgi:hypothetical protein
MVTITNENALTQIKVTCETAEVLSVQLQAFIKGEKGDSQTSDYYDIKILSGNIYTFENFTLPNLSLYTLKSVNESLKVICDGIKFWWNDNDQDFGDQFVQSGNTLEFLNQVERIEIEFYNKLILI